MNKTICQLAMALALASLVGCGLKGPLYFPPKDKSDRQQVQPQPTSQDPRMTQPDGAEENPTTINTSM
ncbi:hypothetical protein ED28_06370 [[Pantoea] beijingensis]|uniref:LPS-assembly lipoprotein LptM n=1 Tax=[Pantoea] beijingensis TaxID=1324864 RepID=A0A443IFA9_9GAMM|nr:lipoprotein [[Pantoea] beijingensis]RWR02757.1 hypothetical protein ED28_06370 [[Pantoea] beijingensis]